MACATGAADDFPGGGGGGSGAGGDGSTTVPHDGGALDVNAGDDVQLSSDTGLHVSDVVDSSKPDSSADAVAEVGPPADAGSDTGVDAPEEAGPDSSVPTTCTEADDTIGCCDGKDLYYCKTTTVTKKACTGSDVCGWDSKADYYDCVDPPGGADPSGKHPIACK
jgi:hypothetical protein